MRRISTAARHRRPPVTAAALAAPPLRPPALCSVVEAVREQVGKGIHLQQNCGISRPLVALIEKLNANTPAELTKFFFNCTGTEAVESAIKLARHETGRQNVLHMKGSFHGRSLGAMAMTTSKYAYRVGYGPLPAGFHQVPFPYCAQCTCAKPAGGGCCGYPLQQIHETLKETSAPSDTAAIIIEPILGEGGYVVPPPGYMRQLRALCDAHGILLIADEVQSVSRAAGGRGCAGGARERAL